MALIEEAQKAARILLDHAYVRIVARASPDAVCATALLAHALRRESVDFHASFVVRLDEATAADLTAERADCLVLIGLAGDAVEAPLAGRRIVLDPPGAAVAADASVRHDAALASLAQLVAAGVSRRNVDLAPLALAGTLAASRHIGGMHGLDVEVLQEAIEGGVLLREATLALQGTTLLHAITQLDAPYVAGVTGRARNVKKLASDLGLAGESPPGATSAEQAERLADVLVSRLLQQGAPDAAFDALFRPNLRALQGPCTGLECGELARLAEGACAAGKPGLAFAALWSDASAGGQALEILGTLRDDIVAALMRAEREMRREGRLVTAEVARADLCRPLADRIAASLAPAGALVAVHAPEGGGTIIALRGWGLDAGAIARQAAGPAGASASGAGSEATMRAPDASRALKALAEAIA